MSEYIIYGTQICNFCDYSKDLLDKYEKGYTFVDVSENQDATAAFFKKFRMSELCLRLNMKAQTEGILYILADITS